MSSAFEESGFLTPTFLEGSSLLTSKWMQVTFDVGFVFEDAESVVHFVVGEELVDDFESLESLRGFMQFLTGRVFPVERTRLVRVLLVYYLLIFILP